MSRLRCVRSRGIVAFVALLVSCQAKPPTVARGSEAIDVRESDPPPGSKSLGPIESANGRGCGLYGAKGSYDGALAALRNEAEERGGDFVRVTRVTEPHVEGGCYEERFVIRGMLFRVNPAPVGTSVEAPAATPSAEACVPPCSPGYACQSGTCRAECNPTCGAGQTCGQDRTCRPTAP